MDMGPTMPQKEMVILSRLQIVPSYCHGYSLKASDSPHKVVISSPGSRKSNDVFVLGIRRLPHHQGIKSR